MLRSGLSLLVVALVLLGAAAGCLGTERLPQAAQQAVVDQACADYAGWLALPESFDKFPEIKIRRAWRAKDLPAESSATEKVPTMWCVELVMTGQRLGSKVETSEIWVVMGSEDPPQWTAAALRTISSLIPYERCGQDP